MPAVGDALLQHQLHQLLGGRRHILKALSERNDRKAHALKVLHHLHSAPTVKGDLPDVEPLALPLPHIVWHMVTPDSEVEVVFRYPEVRQDDVSVVLIFRRKHQNECCNIRCGGQVQTTVADTTFQIILADGELAFVPLIHRHPAHRLFDPLVES